MAKRKIKHIPDITFGGDNIRGNISFARVEAAMNRAQWWLGEQVLADCKPYMPMRTGSLQQRSHTEDEGRKVVFPGPYAHYLYVGRVMVDKETGKGPANIPGVGPRFREGAKLVYTDRPLHYSRPSATSKWFKTAKARHGDYWVARVKQIIGGK